jgi:hypothetical protein
LPATGGAAYTLPETVAGPTRPGSQVWPPSRPDTSEVMSLSAPAAANSGTSVLPISTMSGGSSWDSAVLIRVLMLVHSCIWTLTLAPVALAKAALIAAWSGLLRSPSMYHTVRVLPANEVGPAPVAAAVAAPPELLHAAAQRASETAAASVARERLCTWILLGNGPRPSPCGLRPEWSAGAGG